MTEGRDGPFYRLRIESKRVSQSSSIGKVRYRYHPISGARPTELIDAVIRRSMPKCRAPLRLRPRACISTKSLFSTLGQRGIATEFITLHVGAGTFQPIRAEHVRDHRMHKRMDFSARTGDRGGSDKLGGGVVGWWQLELQWYEPWSPPLGQVS